MVASPGDSDVFCDGRRGMKALANQPSALLCLEAASNDPGCVMEYGVAYADPSNDPTKTWRQNRCECFKGYPCSVTSF